MPNSYTKSLSHETKTDWDFYFCEVDDRPAIISVDLNLAMQVPMSELPYLAYVSVKINRKSAEGFPEPSELGTLCRLEDHLLDVLGAGKQTRFCGRVTTNGCRDLIFYVENPADATALLQSAMQQFPQYKFEIGWREDTTWELYLDFLFPNENELNNILNARVVAQMSQDGEQLETKRLLDHAAFFPDVENRDRFILWAIDNYFSIGKVHEERPGQPFPWTVNFSRLDPVNIEAINALTDEIIIVAHEHKGTYDGWETEKRAV